MEASTLAFIDTKNTDNLTFANIPCSKSDYKVRSEGCSPSGDGCFRRVWNNFTSEEEVEALKRVATSVMSFGGGAGGPTIFDLVSGALSKGENFVNIFKVLEIESAKLGEGESLEVLKKEDLEVLLKTILRIKEFVSSELGITNFYFTNPLFFSRMDGRKARTFHDEYWHPHVDSKQYGTFTYTTLLYLSERETDFKGGNFVFKNSDGSKLEVSPVPGRLVMFTSGAENEHFVEPVTQGLRFALTTAFTCSEAHSSEEAIIQNIKKLEPHAI
eukprot:TRINITY_DN9436_c0_g1_i1.p1 TRINITY_DN9436_c0_g1~~TRINITY_DN9436_c0_g1_i1.p1  ORF type:complete len:316 (+),score=50.03 TRINITY_DN9436_c0_g1_i1:134-949(+)